MCCGADRVIIVVVAMCCGADRVIIVLCLYESTVYSYLIDISGSPPSPIQGPRLVSSTLLADVTLSVSKSVPPTSDQEHPLEPVGIVYRVVDKKTNVTRYFQMVTKSRHNILLSAW